MKKTGKSISPGSRRLAGTSKAPAKKWTWHKRTLLALQRRLLTEQLRQLQDVRPTAEPSPDEPVSGPGPEPDFALALLLRERDALKEINDALERIRQGIYGICEATGLALPSARLRAVPWARHVRDVGDRREPSPFRKSDRHRT